MRLQKASIPAVRWLNLVVFFLALFVGANRYAMNDNEWEYADLVMKIDYSIFDGPGTHLLGGIYLGNTIAQQSFKTQFIQDLSGTLNISVNRLYVVRVEPGNVHYSWSSRYVLVTFRLFGPNITVTPENQNEVPEMSGSYDRREGWMVNRLYGDPSYPDAKPIVRVVQELTEQIQSPNSDLFTKNVTQATDPLWGLVALDWDVSLRLAYSIEAVGGPLVQKANQNNDQTTLYFNQGAARYCRDTMASEEDKWRGFVEETDGGAPPFGDWSGTNITANRSIYCEFEKFFIDDIHNALNVSVERLDILFIKAASLDNVLVYFRLFPAERQGESSTAYLKNELLVQTQNLSSPLYQGNVTIRTDPAWGVSGAGADRRYESFYMTYKQMPTTTNAYERCKFCHRCARAYEHYDQHSATIYFTAKVHDGGGHFPAALFTDFEDWRVGTYGWSHRGFDTVPRDGKLADRRPRGAQFSPFNFTVLGPSIPTHAPFGRIDEPARGAERPSEGGGQTDEHVIYEAQQGFINSGLVLNNATLQEQVLAQVRLLNAIQEDIDFTTKYFSSAIMDAKLRARRDVSLLMQQRLDHLTERYEFEIGVYQNLSTSQCAQQACEITFNTSSLQLTGAIEDSGIVALTKRGSEVAVFTFDSIELGPEVKITLVGQRALVLLSRSSIVINTTFNAEPGTIGGFQGGFSWGRRESDSLSDSPLDLHLRSLQTRSSMASGTQLSPLSPFTQTVPNGTASNNVNGPGSGNVRVYLQTVQTYAEHIPEVQTISTAADPDQTLSGGFRLHYNGYTTRFIPHDASAAFVKRSIEVGLNFNEVDRLRNSVRANHTVPGVGRVNVTRSRMDDEGGYSWTVTFTTTTGNIPPLTKTNLLAGLGSSVTIETIQEGNSLGGMFTLNFLGLKSRPLPHDIHPENLQNILEEDFSPKLLKAHVRRNDPTRNFCSDTACPDGPFPTFSRCSDGMCQDGPHPAGGFTWTITLTTQEGNVSPPAPRHPLHSVEGVYRPLRADGALLTGLGSKITVSPSHARSQFQILAKLNATIPFSLAFGGGGAGHGGRGGDGYGDNFASGTTGLPYNNERLSDDITGGSGGQMGYIHPHAQHEFANPTGRGGDGGGAIHLVAVNDITIGNKGVLNVSAGDGQRGHVSGGGGGSGGSLLLSAGGVIDVSGTLLASGGDGGLAYDQSTFSEYTQQDSAGGGGGSGGRIAFYAQSVTRSPDAVVDIHGGQCRSLAGYDIAWNSSFDENTTVPPNSSYYEYPATNSSSSACQRHGGDGTFHMETQFGLQYGIDRTKGVYGTLRSLKIESSERIITASEVMRRGPFSFNGPEYNVAFQCEREARGSMHRTPHDVENITECLRAERISFFTMIDATDHTSKARQGSWGSLFVLWPAQYQGTGGQNGSTFDGVENDTAVMIGISLTDSFRHGANFNFEPGDLGYFRQLSTFESFAQERRWYKVDISINWNTNEYDIRLDDVVVVRKAPFQGKGIARVGLYNYHQGATWFDEVYIGRDDTMSFDAPQVDYDGIKMDRPLQTGWPESALGDRDRFQPMQRHGNHILERPLYTQSNGGNLVPYDGKGYKVFSSDIKQRFLSGDHRPRKGGVYAGALVYLPFQLVPTDISKLAVNKDSRDMRKAGDAVPPPETELQWTFGDTNGLYTYDGKLDVGRGKSGIYYWYGEHNEPGQPFGKGAVVAASTDDLQTWRNEGIMLHYENITDMVSGLDGPFTVERPKVVYNTNTKKYVMWMIIDNEERSLGMAGIAISDYPNGPFDFIRSFYPDGNQTRDQTVWRTPNGEGFLGRTYYANVEFVLPEPVMMPWWSLVMNPDGTENFAMTYHRTFYKSDYDNYHDIYLQRWRFEDRDWNVVCVDRITLEEREVPPDQIRDPDDPVCIDPDEFKIVRGQGQPMIESRFKDPFLINNSYWKAESVPGVQSQLWKYNYMDGECGIRNLDLLYDRNDPFLDSADFPLPTNQNCSNVADNALHPTLPDRLIGREQAVMTRRTKYVAISRLTDDFLDTSGILFSFEGELEDEADMMLLQTQYGMFDWRIGTELGSSYQIPVKSDDYATRPDFQSRFHQYETKPNDRAKYSLACVIDGSCPVNFKDQVEVN